MHGCMHGRREGEDTACHDKVMPAHIERERKRGDRTRLHLLLASLFAQLSEFALAVLSPRCKVLGVLLYLPRQQHLRHTSPHQALVILIQSS